MPAWRSASNSAKGVTMLKFHFADGTFKEVPGNEKTLGIAWNLIREGDDGGAKRLLFQDKLIVNFQHVISIEHIDDEGEDR